MSNEKNEYVVYPDKIRYGLTILIYSLFVIIEAYVLLTSKLHTTFIVLLVILMAFFVWQIGMNIRTLLKDEPLITISNKGIKDNTSLVDYGFIPWKEVQRIQTYPGGTSLQIGIAVSLDYAFPDSSSYNARKIAERSQMRSGYTLSIDGFGYRRKIFKKIFHTIKENALNSNPQIIIEEYEDPLIKRAKKNKSQKLNG